MYRGDPWTQSNQCHSAKPPALRQPGRLVHSKGSCLRVSQPILEIALHYYPKNSPPIRDRVSTHLTLAVLRRGVQPSPPCRRLLQVYPRAGWVTPQNARAKSMAPTDDHRTT
jgi:hypothetical protein